MSKAVRNSQDPWHTENEPIRGQFVREASSDIKVKLFLQRKNKKMTQGALGILEETNLHIFSDTAPRVSRKEEKCEDPGQPVCSSWAVETPSLSPHSGFPNWQFSQSVIPEDERLSYMSLNKWLSEQVNRHLHAGVHDPAAVWLTRGRDWFLREKWKQTELIYTKKKR